MGRKFTPTTFVLVGVLIAALYGVGHLVTPPPTPPAPVEKPPANTLIAQDPATKAKVQKEMADRMKMEMEKHKQPAMPPGGFKKDPTAVDISSDYYKDHAMGEKGITETQEIVAKAQAEKAHSPASASPVPVPTFPGKMIPVK